MLNGAADPTAERSVVGVGARSDGVELVFGEAYRDDLGELSAAVGPLFDRYDLFGAAWGHAACRTGHDVRETALLMKRRWSGWLLTMNVVFGTAFVALVSAALASAGWHVREPEDFECFVHLPPGWDESTQVEGARRLLPPGTECTFTHAATGEVRLWETPRVASAVLSGAAGTVAAASIVVTVKVANRRRKPLGG